MIAGPRSADRVEDLFVRGVLARSQLRIHEAPVDGDLEGPAAGIDQLDLDVIEPVREGSRQTGSFRPVVSDDAVLDRHVHGAPRLWPVVPPLVGRAAFSTPGRSPREVRFFNPRPRR